jgi:hypothetical protein
MVTLREAMVAGSDREVCTARKAIWKALDCFRAALEEYQIAMAAPKATMAFPVMAQEKMSAPVAT